MRFLLHPLVWALACSLAACASAPSATNPHSPGALGECQRTLADLRVRAAAREAARRAELGERLFRAGKYQQGATRALAPLLKATLIQQYGKDPDFSLLCHTWVCKLTLTLESSTRKVEFPDPVDDRIQSMAITEVHEIMWDRQTGQRIPFQQVEILLFLRHPAGERRTIAELRAEAAGPAPSSEDGCRTQLAEAQTQDARAEEEYRQQSSNVVIAFQAGKPSRALTADTARLLRGAFGLPPGPDDQVVECKETVCKLLIPVDGERVRKLRAAVLGYRYDWTAAGNPTENYLWWRTEAWGNSRQVLVEAGRAAAAARSRCDGRPPGRGDIAIRVQLPAADTSGPPPKPVMTAQGSLVDTPLGRCVIDLVTEKIRSSPVRGPFARSSRTLDFVFPLRP